MSRVGMMLEDVIPQVDGGTRYLVSTPRGYLGVDVEDDGSVAVTRCLGASDTTSRDLREARRLVESMLADEAEDLPSWAD